jgi:hypothetical protein
MTSSRTVPPGPHSDPSPTGPVTGPGPAAAESGADESQVADPSVLAHLREWAWSHGRTDVVGRLDTYAAALEFVTDPTMVRLIRLSDLLPVRPRSDWVEAAVRELRLGGAGSAALAGFAANVNPFTAMLRWQLVADLDEMRAAL